MKTLNVRQVPVLGDPLPMVIYTHLNLKAGEFIHLRYDADTYRAKVQTAIDGLMCWVIPTHLLPDND